MHLYMMYQVKLPYAVAVEPHRCQMRLVLEPDAPTLAGVSLTAAPCRVAMQVRQVIEF